MPRRAGSRVACGLAVIAAAAMAVQCAVSPAGAAARPRPSPRPLVSKDAAVRDIQYVVMRNVRSVVMRNVRSVRPAAKAIRPGAIQIPSIGLSVRLITLGGPTATASHGVLSLPVPSLAEAATAAGWYQFTAVPGAAGNAVIVGHVDTYAGPAVFYNLYRLRPGDKVDVSAEGVRQRFDVTSVRELPKSSFPVDQVFGGTSKHTLWLITCGGDFDSETGHYLDNIIVSTAWDPVRKSPNTSNRKPKRRQIMLRVLKKALPGN
jgi:sortase (surface protein transpeptidase)